MFVCIEVEVVIQEKRFCGLRGDMLDLECIGLSSVESRVFSNLKYLSGYLSAICVGECVLRNWFSECYL